VTTNISAAEVVLCCASYKSEATYNWTFCPDNWNNTTRHGRTYRRLTLVPKHLTANVKAIRTNVPHKQKAEPLIFFLLPKNGSLPVS